jgi:CRISPR/Cas system-associated endoribonuclease Cas2
MAWGQEDKLATLLGEREQLLLEYEFYNNQNSNFWGKKSKKDLLQVIQTLKNIINKDSEIIRQINTLNLITRAQTHVETTKIKRQVVDDQRLNMENLHQLKQELASLQNLQKVKDRELLQLREDLQQARASRQHADSTIAAAGGICLLLLIYIFILRSKIPAASSTARKKR